MYIFAAYLKTFFEKMIQAVRLLELKVITSLCIMSVLMSVDVFAQNPIEIGTKHTLHSEVMNAEYEYWVSLPRAYSDTTYSVVGYPVCYFFDGDSHFETLVSQRNRLSSGFYAAMPEVIMVGIVQRDRTNELTPSHMETPENWKRADFSTSGGNEAFMKFIDTELKPQINQTYRTMSYEILIGHSFGGLATAHALLHSPGSFDAYVALDPSIWWNGAEMLNEINQVWKADAYENVSFYMAKATDPGSGDEHRNAIVELAEDLDSLSVLSGLRFGYKIYHGEDHGSVVVPAEYDALRFIFEGYQLDVKATMRDPSLVEDHYEGVARNLGYEVLPPEWLLDQLATICRRQGLDKQAEEFIRMAASYYPQSKHAQRRLIEISLTE